MVSPRATRVIAILMNFPETFPRTRKCKCTPRLVSILGGARIALARAGARSGCFTGPGAMSGYPYGHRGPPPPQVRLLSPPSRPPPRPPPRVTRALKETNNISCFSFSFSDDDPRPYRRRASVTDPQLLLQHLVTHSSSTTSRLRAGTVGNRDTTTATASPTINTNSSLTAEMPLTLHSTRRFRGTLGAGARDSSRVGGGTRGSNSRSCSATLARFCPRAVGMPYRTRSSPSTLFASTSSMW